MNNVALILEPIDAEKFKLFQKHYVAFMMLDSMGAFQIKNGSCTLDFNAEGQIKGFRKEQYFRP